MRSGRAGERKERESDDDDHAAAGRNARGSRTHAAVGGNARDHAALGGDDAGDPHGAVAAVMVRKRVRIARGRATRLGIVVAGLLALGVAWYAGAAVALGLGADPGTVDGLTGYRAAVDWLAAPHAPDGTTRAIVAAAGVLTFVVLGRLALAQLPRPQVPRAALVLEHDARGTTTVEPRAIERAVESALSGFDSVAARWEDGHVTAAVTSSRPRGLPDALAAAPAEASAALRRHGLPEAEVEVVLRRVRSSSNREVL